MYSEMIPTEYQDELLALRDSLTMNSWRVGDISLKIAQRRMEFHPTDIYAAVGSFVGKAERTIREYAAISAFYAYETREEYDMLAYDHFRAAMRLGDEWKTALDWAADQVKTLNRPATVDAMESQFEGNESLANFANDGENTGMLLSVLKRLRELLYSKYVHLSDLHHQELDKLITAIEQDM